MSRDANPAGEELLRRLPGSVDVALQAFDLARDRALLVELGASTYRQASFLDERVLKPGAKAAWVELGRVMRAARDVALQHPLHFIFHTGHVGSTLVSRLLDETGAVLPLREPAALRQLAETHDALGRVDSLLSDRGFAILLGGFLRLWGRGDAATKAVVLKATSSTGRMAPALLAAHLGTYDLFESAGGTPHRHATERMNAMPTCGLGLSGSGVLLPMVPPAYWRCRHSRGELAAASWLQKRLTERSTPRVRE
jgi:hypothetical protein